MLLDLAVNKLEHLQPVDKLVNALVMSVMLFIIEQVTEHVIILPVYSNILAHLLLKL